MKNELKVSDPSKEAQEIILMRKLQTLDYPPLYFNSSSVKQTFTQKHLGMLLDFKLDFQEHCGSLLKFQNILPRRALLTIYRYFVGTHLNYGGIIYDQGFSNSLHIKMNPFNLTPL